jgi:hypothetical protein
MNCYTRLGIVTVLSFGILAGCSKSSPSGSAAAGGAAPESAPAITETDPNSSPMARAAYDFLTAVLKGDTQAASNKLTPQAIQRIIASGKQFSPPGLENATFKIGEVRAPSADQAIVQCVLTDASEGQPHSEEMCCLLRKVDNDWRVSGIAYGTAPNMPWTLSDFETGQNVSIPRQTMGGMANNQGNGGQPGNAGVQANVVAPPVSPPAPLGMPSVGPANVNSPNVGASGLGMPAVGPAATGQQQPYSPYTAQEPQQNDRR